MRQFIELDLPMEEQLALLTDLGLEVEGSSPFESIPGSLKGVVVGKVLACEPHPNADRLRVTQVDIGQSESVQIVCGAPNVAKDQNVPVATVGTTLYDKTGAPWEIKKSKIRGEVSMGMICAEDELNLGDSHEGILVLDNDLTPGTPCAQLFAIEQDNSIEIGLTPNRCDAMSHMGVARDLKAGCIQRNIPYKWTLPTTDTFKINNTTFPIGVVVEEPKLAPRYLGITLSNVQVKPSPAWIQNRLKAIGLSPINNVVDITNYVLHDLGQPLHAFDADKIQGNIVVKTLPQDTPFITLDGDERKLDAEDLMICDEVKPLCIAGVFGGLHSGVTQDTTRVFLEAAYFDPVSIRKSAKRHGLNTDASFRFERGIDPEIGEFALKRAAQLIQQYCDAEITSEIVDVAQPLPEQTSLFILYDQISKLLGQEIPKEELINILNALEIEIINVTEDGFSIKIPRYRVDVTREADVIEEILRVYGYNNIKSVNTLKSFYPTFAQKTPFSVEQNIAKKLVGLGFTEMINNSITSPTYATRSKQLNGVDKVTLLNPLGQELSELRSSLIFSALEVIAFNQNRQQRDLKLYEFGKTYRKTESGFNEEKRLTIAMTGRIQQDAWNSLDANADFYHLKGTVVALLQSVGLEAIEEDPSDHDIVDNGIVLRVKNQPVAYLGNVSAAVLKSFYIEQQVVIADINFDRLYTLAFADEILVQPIPKFPSSRRDFALLIDQHIQFKTLRKAAQKVERKILKDINLFDVYQGKNLPEGKKSYGISFHFEDPNKTLTDKHIDKVMQKLKHTFENEFGATLR